VIPAAASSDGWTEAIVALSIFVPVVVTIVLAVYVLRGAKNDPDEQRWRQLKESQRSE